MRIRTVIFWGCAIGLLVLGGLGYSETIWGFHVGHARILLLAFVTLTVADRLLRYYLQTRAEKHARQFRIIESHTVAQPRDSLNGLTWDGTHFWFTGRVDGISGVFKLSDDFTIDESISIPDAFPYGVISSDNLIVLTAMRERYEVRNYTSAGELVKITPLNVGLQNMPATLAFDGSQFWLAIDEANVIYVLSLDLTVLRQQPLPHRVLGSTYRKGRLWITDAYKLYEYDTALKLANTYDYPGTTCRGITFRNATFWSLDDGPKRIHKHVFA